MTNYCEYIADFDNLSIYFSSHFETKLIDDESG